jgi:5'-nucleotidase
MQTRRASIARIARTGICVAAFCAAFASSAQKAGPADGRPRILVTNDDGIDAPGIHALANALREMAEVVVIAPQTNKSAKSMSSELDPKLTPSGRFESKNLKLNQVRDASGRLFGYSLDCTPVDCVGLGLAGLVGNGHFDFVVSGINDNVNLGMLSACISGTLRAVQVVGAYPEWDIHAIAVSQATGKTEADFRIAADFTKQVIQQIQAEGFPKGVVLSINVPPEPKGFVVAPLGTGFLGSTEPISIDKTTGEFKAVFGRRTNLVEDTHSDYHQFFVQQKIVLTPFKIHVVETNLYTALGRWNININTAVSASK